MGDNMTKELEAEFHQAMINTYYEASRLGYHPTFFLREVNRLGGVGAARKLLRAPAAQPGLTRLWELGRLDISAEALVLKERWQGLFSDAERQEARKRLAAHGYDPSQR